MLHQAVKQQSALVASHLQHRPVDMLQVGMERSFPKVTGVLDPTTLERSRSRKPMSVSSPGLYIVLWTSQISIASWLDSISLR